MRAPVPTSHGNSGGTPVKARAESLLPELPELPSDELADVGRLVELVGDVVVVVEPVAPVVVVVVDPDPVVVVVVVDPLDCVNWTVTGSLVRSTPSVVSSAVYVTDSAEVSVTVKSALPVLVVVPFTAVTVEPPPEAESVTTLPGTAIPSPS